MRRLTTFALALVTAMALFAQSAFAAVVNIR
jgi:hypothetical protein